MIPIEYAAFRYLFPCCIGLAVDDTQEAAKCVHDDVFFQFSWDVHCACLHRKELTEKSSHYRIVFVDCATYGGIALSISLYY